MNYVLTQNDVLKHSIRGDTFMKVKLTVLTICTLILLTSISAFAIEQCCQNQNIRTGPIIEVQCADCRGASWSSNCANAKHTIYYKTIGYHRTCSNCFTEH